MKKNLMSVLILALVLVNLILTAILTISVLPQTKKANELITQVCAAINLELQSGEVKDASTVPIGQQESYPLSELTINLKDSVIVDENGKTTTSGGHYVVLTPYVSMDTKADGYKEYGSAEEMALKEDMIKNVINKAFQKYTVEECREDEKAISEQIVKELQKLFQSEFIFDVGYSKITYQ